MEYLDIPGGRALVQVDVGADRLLLLRCLSFRRRVVIDQLGQRLERQPAEVCIECDEALRPAQQRLLIAGLAAFFFLDAGARNRSTKMRSTQVDSGL